MHPTTIMTAWIGVPLVSLLAQQPSVPPPAAPASEPPSARQDAHDLAPAITGDALVHKARIALDKGFAFLVSAQNPDGSWGSHDPKIAELADFGFKLRNRGSQDGVRQACTAICARALMYKQPRTAAEDAALQRAVDALLKQDQFAYHRGEAFNTWGYGYKLDFIVDCLQFKPSPAPRERLIAAANACVKGLRRYQQADGGWNYYAGPTMGGASMSFNTAVFARALHMAKREGVDVPPGMAEDAARLLRRMRTAKGGFVYDARFLNNPRSVNELSAGSRTAACALALFDMGAMTSDDLESAMVVFKEGENYLEDGRKLIQPHTAVHQISGYFFFFGYNYITMVAEHLGPRATNERWERFAWTMVRTQEPNGCWWDTAAAEYGDKWGTGFALQSLQRYLEYVDRMASGDQ